MVSVSPSLSLHVIVSLVAFARFCEAIIDYVADEQRAEASGINCQQFEGEVFSAYDTFFNVWLLSKDARVSVH